MAKLSGCDAVKFQKRTIDIVYDKKTLDSDRESPWGKTQREQKMGLEFNENEYDEINAYCKNIKIDWFSSWDIDSQKMMQKYDLKYNKIASAMLPYTPLLEVVADEGKYTFISTGMSTYDEIDTAINVFKKKNCPFELMYTTSMYPSEVEDIDINCIKELKKRYNCKVGYSGHEKSAYFVSLAAAYAVHHQLKDI